MVGIFQPIGMTGAVICRLAEILGCFCAFSAAWGADKEIRTVVSEGVGRNVNEATQNAVRNALNNVVGTFIDANTLVSKRTEINNGLREQSKSITKDIQQYSQGVVRTVEVVNTEDNGLITVTAKVGVEIDDFKVYMKKLTEDTVNISNGLFAKLKTEQDQITNLHDIFFNKIYNPLKTGQAVDVKLSEPLSYDELIKPENLNLSGRDRTKVILDYIDRKRSEAISSGQYFVGFKVSVLAKEDYLQNITKTLDSIASNKANLRGVPLYPSGNHEGYAYAEWAEKIGSEGNGEGFVVSILKPRYGKGGEGVEEFAASTKTYRLPNIRSKVSSKGFARERCGYGLRIIFKDAENNELTVLNCSSESCDFYVPRYFEHGGINEFNKPFHEIYRNESWKLTILERSEFPIFMNVDKNVFENARSVTATLFEQ